MIVQAIAEQPSVRYSLECLTFILAAIGCFFAKSWVTKLVGAVQNDIVDVRQDVANIRMDIASLSGRVDAIPNAMKVEIYNAMNGTKDRLTKLEATCDIRHSERKAEMQDLMAGKGRE